MTDTAIRTAVQQDTPGEYVAMFSLDTSAYGGPVMNFCEAAINDAGVTFNGVYYTPVDFNATGFEMSGVGGLPTPKIKIANANGVIQNMINTYGDLIGCPITRIRTFSKFLDGQPQADPNAFFGPDMFRVDRVVNANAIFVEWELSASLDNQGAMIPKRMVIRDTCTWRYRRWNPATGAFDYSNVQCPYTGALMNASDLPETDPTKDACSRTVNGCKIRFGAGSPLPYGGFPGVARFQ